MQKIYMVRCREPIATRCLTQPSYAATTAPKSVGNYHTWQIAMRWVCLTTRTFATEERGMHCRLPWGNSPLTKTIASRQLPAIHSLSSLSSYSKVQVRHIRIRGTIHNRTDIILVSSIRKRWGHDNYHSKEQRQVLTYTCKPTNWLLHWIQCLYFRNTRRTIAYCLQYTPTTTVSTKQPHLDTWIMVDGRW